MQQKTLVNRSNLAVYYKNLDVRVTTEFLLYDFSSLVAAIGGSLGLFLGVSCYQMALEAWQQLILMVSSIFIYLIILYSFLLQGKKASAKFR